MSNKTKRAEEVKKEQYYIFAEVLDGETYFRLMDEPMEEDIAEFLMSVSTYSKHEYPDGDTFEVRSHLFIGYLSCGTDKEEAAEILRRCERNETLFYDGINGHESMRWE